MQWIKQQRKLQTIVATMALIALSGSLGGCDPDCANLSESKCKAKKGCGALRGRDKEGNWKYAGCSGADEAGSAITCAVPEEDAGECLQFSNTAIPDGWEVVPCDGVRCPGEP